MARKHFSILGLLVMVSLLLAACGGDVATAVPAVVPTNTTAMAAATNTTAMAAPTNTTAMAAPTNTTAMAAATNTIAMAAPTNTTAAGTGTMSGMGDPKAAALAAAGGKQLGGSLDLLGVWAGGELDSFNATIQPFEDATGIKVQYEATRDFNAVLTTRVNGGNPPDIAAPPSASQVAQWASEGKLVALDSIVDMAKLKSDDGQSWIDLASYQGKMYAVFAWSALKGAIWYDPKQYKGPKAPKSWDELMTWSQQTAASGTTPWCIGLESGAASGWPGTDWIEDIVLRAAGPDKYMQWYQGKLAWTSPEIKSAFQAFGKIAGDRKMVYGGAATELTLNFGNAGDQLFKSPPGCYLHHQASFITTFFEKNTPGIKAGQDYDFFFFPDINPQYAGAAEVAGDEFSIYKDTPQARAFIRYMTTPEAQSIWVHRGGKLPVNKRVSTDVYPDALSKHAGEIITSAKVVQFDASDLMPDAMNQAFWKGILDYVQSPDNLDSILANLDSVQKDAYKK